MLEVFDPEGSLVSTNLVLINELVAASVPVLHELIRILQRENELHLCAGVNILHFIGKLFPVKIGIFGLTFPYLLTKSVKTTNFSPLINGE